MACPEAAVGWGVPLTNAPVGWSPHPSIRHLIADYSLLLDPEPIGEQEQYWEYLEVAETGYSGHPRSAQAVFIKRSATCTGDSTGDVDPATLAPPTPDELAVINRYLDETGFTGDRTVRLLLTAREV